MCLLAGVHGDASHHVQALHREKWKEWMLDVSEAFLGRTFLPSYFRALWDQYHSQIGSMFVPRWNAQDLLQGPRRWLFWVLAALLAWRPQPSALDTFGDF